MKCTTECVAAVTYSVGAASLLCQFVSIFSIDWLNVVEPIVVTRADVYEDEEFTVSLEH